ncbi:16956_t:CDS:1, partial [Dentiscutata heterogama]
MKYKELPNFIFLITLSFIIIGFIASVSADPLSFDIEEVTSSIQPSKRDIYDKRGEDGEEDYEEKVKRDVQYLSDESDQVKRGEDGNDEEVYEKRSE